MFKKFKRIFIGRPLKNEALGDEKYSVFWGLPILSSDAVSSVAYAIPEILIAMTLSIGLLVYTAQIYICLTIIGLLILLILSYRQTIESYPNGGGAYIVAKENIGVFAGVAAGAALSTDYVMTVAVSISSGVDQIISLFGNLKPYKVEIVVLIIILIAIGNLRGIRESSKMFGIPVYAFILIMFLMIIVGLFKIFTGNYDPVEHTKAVASASGPLTLMLILKAFSNGCSALTGVEAVSNAVPNFKSPSTKHAKSVLVLLGVFITVILGGLSLIISKIQIESPYTESPSVLVQLSKALFHSSFMPYVVMTVTFIILAMAANTAYSGFPMLISVMAKEEYVPRQFSMRGDRLSYSNGIIALTLATILIIIPFKANVTKLIGLYAIGVFISFTLSQTGMFIRWYKKRGKYWVLKAFINGLGAIVTSIVVVIVAIVKFNQGSWIVIIVVPILMFLMLKVKKHYVAVSLQLRIKPEELSSIDVSKEVYKNRVIVPVESMNKSSIRALRYARTISDNVVAFNVSIDEESGKKIRERYDMLKTDIPLIIKYSPFRKVVDPLLKFIESAEYDYQKGDMITVILPQFAVKSRWHTILHNRTWKYIQKQLLKHKHIVVSTMPLQLKDDHYVLKNPKYK